MEDFVLNGDRHWQYHSIDKETGLNEFGSGPASNVHAGGWSQNNKLPAHQFLRVKGGFLSVTADAKQATLHHHDVDGRMTTVSGRGWSERGLQLGGLCRYAIVKMML